VAEWDILHEDLLLWGTAVLLGYKNNVRQGRVDIEVVGGVDLILKEIA
jgi:hypothetical protein